MAKIKIIFRNPLAKSAGVETNVPFEIEAKNIKEVLSFIKKNYSKEAKNQAKKMLITVNDKREEKFREKFNDGDIVKFLPVAGGG